MLTPQPLTPSPCRILLGYFASVVAATLSLEVLLAAQHVFNRGFGSSSLAFHIRESIVFGFVVVVMATVAAALPCLLAEGLAKLLGIRSAWWFVLWGAAVSLGFGPLVAALPDTAGQYAHALRTYGADFVLSGATGGLTHWWVSRKLLANQGRVQR